jgi:hypothetical protein
MESGLDSQSNKVQGNDGSCGLLLKVWNMENKASLEWTKMESYKVESNFA